MTDDLEAALRAIPLCGDHVQWGKSHDGECLGCDLEVARAALAEMRGRVCDTCQHRFVGMAPVGRPHFTYCKLTKVPVPELGTQTFVMCVVLGNTCGAWQERIAP